MASSNRQYQPKDAIDAAIKGAMITGTAGLFVSAIQNTLTKQRVGAWGVFTRTGGTIGVFTAMGSIYEFVKVSSANLREKDDSLNTVYGGFLAGSVLGLKHGSTSRVLGFGALTAVVLGAFDYTGGTFSGYNKDPEIDEFERKQHLRKNRRRPIEETIAEIGEGRGIYAPGYQERRRERLKAKYGIDVPAKEPKEP